MPGCDRLQYGQLAYIYNASTASAIEGGQPAALQLDAIALLARHALCTSLADVGLLHSVSVADSNPKPPLVRWV